MSRSVSAQSSVTKTSPCWKGLIVPGSTLMYGSKFCIWTFSPRALRSRPSELAVMPLPSDETTPPVTKTDFGGRRGERPWAAGGALGAPQALEARNERGAVAQLVQGAGLAEEVEARESCD